MSEIHDTSFDTRAVRTPDRDDKGHRSIAVPIVLGTNFQADSSQALGESFRRRGEDVYTRFGHPTLGAAGRHMASLEGAEAGLVFASGMAAITTTLLTVLQAGAHVVAQRQIFA